MGRRGDQPGNRDAAAGRGRRQDLLRGSRTGDAAGRHLLAALDHHTGVVLGQVAVDVKTNEIPALPVLLADLDLTGVIVTADALHTQTETARWLVARGARTLGTLAA